MNTNLSMQFINENCETIGDLNRFVGQIENQQDRTENKLNISRVLITKKDKPLLTQLALTPAYNFPLLIKLCEYTKYKTNKEGR